MGTTIDGVYVGGKTQRRKSALQRLEHDLKSYTNARTVHELKLKEKGLNNLIKELAAEGVEDLTKQITRIEKEIETLKSRI
jgi:hypothetical protein